ncbi:Nuclear distribution protein PAC1 [Zancudomyces culisetae]|nr:Nuclear distribution protein PAC1 [Zancudomyces culisetae]|eukprot:OMH78408.1 Nuclear distribution protein PAC1 [Zancudomyces culisetae]
MGPDRIVSASRDKSIKIWELSSGYCTKTIVGHAEWVRRASVSEDNRLLVTCSNDQSVRVWDGNTGECRLDLRGHENVVECAEFVPSNCYSSIANLLGLDPKIQPNTTPGRYVLSCSRDKLIKLWDSSGQPVHTFVGHDNWVRSLVFHPSGHFFLSVSDDKRLKVWDLKTGRCVRTIDAASHFVTTVAFCPIAPLLATGSVDTNATVWQCK